MARSQNSPRGLFAKWQYRVPVGKGMLFDDYSTSNNLLTANSTGLKVRGGAFIATNVSTALPTSEDKGIAMQLISNSTGVALVVNSTGTTWKYLNTTVNQPT
jgi:hypothetical protein